jgi:hypothetical protein
LRGAIYDLRLEGEHDLLFPELLEALVELHREMAPESDIALEVHDGVFEREAGFEVVAQAASLSEARGCWRESRWRWWTSACPTATEVT